MDNGLTSKVKLTDGAPLPKHAKEGDAGLDLTARQSCTIRPHETKMVGTGTAFEIPSGYVGLVFPRSGLSSKRGINLANCVGVIDSGYRGEVMAPLHNITDEPHYIEEGERVCQIVVVPFETCTCVEAEELADSERGTGGFGSTGRQ